MTEVLLHGVVRRIGPGEGPLAGNCRLRVGEHEASFSLGARCELVGAHGRSIVKIRGDTVVGERKRTARYEDLAGEPGVANLALRPGPHVKSTLFSAWIKDGDAIAVIAEPAGNTIDVATYRESPGATVMYRVLIAGSPPSVAVWRRQQDVKQAVRSKPRPWRALAMAGLAGGAAALIVAAFAAGASTFSFIAPGIAIAMAAAALALWWQHVAIPDFERGSGGGPLLVLAIAGGIGSMLPPMGGATSAVLGGAVLTCMIIGRIWTRRPARLLATLSAPTATPTAGQFGVFAGHVIDRTPIQIGSVPAAIARIVTVEGSGEDASVSTSDRGFDSTFQLRLDDGSELDVDPRDLAWHSEIVSTEEGTYTPMVPIGAEVVVAGTPESIDGTLWLRSTGPESLVLYAAAPGADPRRVVRTKLRHYRHVFAAAAALVALSAILAVAGLTIWS